MRTFASILVVAFVSMLAADRVEAQFMEGSMELRPEAGLAIANTFGVAFGATMAYSFSDAMAFGPYFGFSTAGRAWEGGSGQSTFKTAGSNALYFGGRLYYCFTPESDFPWYVNAGAGVVKFGSVTEFDDGTKIRVESGGQVEELEVKGATCFAFNIGSGTTFPMSDNMNIIFDVNSFIGSQGDVKGKTPSADDIDISQLFEGGAFWLLTTTVGISVLF